VSAGRVLGDRYRIDDLLGSGGMGTVWRCRDLRLDRAVAVKELTGAALSFPMAIERFDREARAVARLAHPNIVALHDVGADDGKPFLVMELIEGRSVAAMLDDRPLPITAAVAIAAQACDGLAAAHAADIIHRDVKPANLLVTGTGLVKICDFGIARLHDGAADADLTGIAPALGSWKYMAPEQASGGPVDARTDLYALGCSLYAMLTGAPPFTGDQMTVLLAHQTLAPASLLTRRAEVPPALDALVQELLRKNPEERPADATEVRTRLAALAHDLAADGATVPAVPLAAVPAAAAADVPAPRSPRRADPPPVAPSAVIDGRETTSGPRRGRLALAGVGLLAATILVAILGVTWPWFPADDIADGAPPVRTDASSGPSVAAPVAPNSANATRRPETRATTEKTIPKPDAAVPSSAAGTRTTGATSSPPPPVDPIVAMRLSIKDQVDAGHLNPAKAPDLYKKVDDIAHAMNGAKAGEADKKVGELRDKLAALHRDGTLATAGFDVLNADLDRLAAAASS